MTSFRIIATKGTDEIGGSASSAVEALVKLLELEHMGRTEIVIKDEHDGFVTRAELFEAAEKEKNAHRT